MTQPPPHDLKTTAAHVAMRNVKPTLLFIEPSLDGHHGAYLHWLLKGALERGFAVGLATSASAMSHESLAALRRSMSEPLPVAALPGLPPLWPKGLGLASLSMKEFWHYRMFKRFFQKLGDRGKPDMVVVPYLDSCAHAAALLGSPFGETPWCGVVMRPTFHCAAMSIKAGATRWAWLREALFHRLLRLSGLTFVGVIDELLLQYSRNLSPAAPRKLIHLQDPAQTPGAVDKRTARRGLGIPNDANVLLVYGHLSERKGVDSLARAAVEPHFPTRTMVLLAGRQDAQTQDFLAREPVRGLLASGRWRQINAFLDAEREDAVFAAADLVWLGYRGHDQGSGVQVRAGRAGLPVIACSQGRIAYLTRLADMGVTTSIDDSAKTAQDVARLMLDERERARCGENGRRFFAGHTPERFCDAFFGPIMDAFAQPKQRVEKGKKALCNRL